MTGLGLAGAIAAALFARERSGIGQEIGMSLFASGIWMLASDIQAAITTGYCHTPGGRAPPPTRSSTSTAPATGAGSTSSCSNRTGTGAPSVAPSGARTWSTTRVSRAPRCASSTVAS